MLSRCLLLLCALVPLSLADTLTALPAVPGSWNGTSNYTVGFVGTVDEGLGDFFTFQCDNPGWRITPTQINPAMKVTAGFAWGPVPPSGLNLKCSYTNQDKGTVVGFTQSIKTTGTNGANNATSVVEPVSTATGELFEPNIPTDLSLGGPLPLEFRRYYGSLINADGFTTRLGNNWAHNFEWLLIVNGPYAEVFAPDFKGELFFQQNGAWQLASTEKFAYQLITGANNTYQFLDPRTNLIYTFSGTGSPLGLSKIQDRNGNTITITQPVNGVGTAVDGLGRIISFTYDATTGNLTKVSDQSGRSVTFNFTNTNLTQVTDANGKIESFTYASPGTFPGLMTSHTMPLGNKPFTQTFDTLGRVATQVDSRGNTTTFTYDQPAGSTSYKNPLGVAMSQTSRVYTDFSSFTDPDNQTLSVAYDANSRRTSITDRLGDKVTRTYHAASGNVASETNALGNTTSFTWTAQTAGGFTFYNLTQITYADGTTRLFVYDANGNVTSMTDQAGKVWKFAYNSRGQVTSQTDPVGRVSSYAYNFDATLNTATDAAGNVTTYSYDAAKRVSQIKFADGSTRSFAYDNRNNILKATDERAKSVMFSYNDNNNLAGVTDALGKSASTTYDTDDHVIKSTDRAGQSVAFTYNALGIPQSLTTPANETFTFGYDTHDRLLSVVDSSGHGNTFGYDKEDVPASVTDGLSRKQSVVTNKLGHVTQFTTPLGENYAVVRDKLERATAITDPAGIATNVTYDPRGPVASLSIGGLSAAFIRDDSLALTGITDPNGSAWKLTRDTAGRLRSRTDPLNRATTYSYDNRSRVSSVQMPGGSLAITYDAVGNLLARKYSDGTSLSYSYDDNNRLTSASGVTLAYDAEGRITNSNGIGVGRDSDGRIASVLYAPSTTFYASGKLVTYSYNSQGLLTSMTDWVGGSTTFVYDAALQLVSITRPNKLATKYTYDAGGRVASITEDKGASIAITRDKAGKVVSDDRTPAQLPGFGPGLLPLTYDAAHQVAGFTYDGMGRVTADSLRTYTWDLASRMTARAGLDGSATVSYDAFGMRTSLTSSGATQNFIWNYATSLPTLTTAQNGSADSRYFVYTPGGLLLYSVDASTNARIFYHFDENGSTTQLTNDAGAVTDSYAVSPYGETVTQTGSTQNPFTWLGQFGVMQDTPQGGVFYMRARYYDSTTARFLSPDPIVSAHPMKVNPYEYARGNPLKFIDPLGTDSYLDELNGADSEPDLAGALLRLVGVAPRVLLPLNSQAFGGPESHDDFPVPEAPPVEFGPGSCDPNSSSNSSLKPDFTTIDPLKPFEALTPAWAKEYRLALERRKLGFLGVLVYPGANSVRSGANFCGPVPNPKDIYNQHIVRYDFRILTDVPGQ